jgi:hypothetical protein
MNDTRQTRGEAHSGRGAAAMAVGLLALAGCIVDESGDHRCDAHQVLIKKKTDVYCTCAPTAIPSDAGFGCTPCGAHEIAESGACVCESGYARLSPTSACTQIQVGQVVLGQPCSSDAECGGDYPLCASTTSGGYCTSTGCTSHSDCSSPWYCESGASPSYCHMPPTGLGVSCASDADCAGFDAAYCELGQSHTCLISECASAPDKCKSWACCDLSAFLGTSLCVPQDQLQGGKCFDGSAPVTP